MFGEIKDIVSLFKSSSVAIDNNVFKLHYKLAVVLLLVFSVFISARQFFGDPIDCVSLDGDRFDNYLDTYCWFNSYVRIRQSDKANCLQLEKFPDVSKRCDYSRDDIKTITLGYYQWIGIVLLIQTAMFYTPRFLWRYVWEEGRVKELVHGMRTHITSDEVKKKEEIIIHYIQEHQGRHSSYFVKFIMCEFLNLINVVGQIYITDWFLGNAFLYYGVDWYSDEFYDTSEYHIRQLMSRDRFFPKETDCTIITGSPGTGPTTQTTKCVLPHQVFNEKIYVFLWFFFVILSIITALFMVFRVATIISPRLRLYLLDKEAILSTNGFTKDIAYKYSIGDWFIIYQMGKNMNPFVFGEVLQNLKRKRFFDEEKQENCSKAWHTTEN